VPGPVVNVALGLIFVFLTSALVCSAAVEWIGNVLNKRGDYLLRGLRELLDIPPSAPSEADAPGTVAGSGGDFLIEKDDRRRRLQELSVTGTELRTALVGATEPLQGCPHPSPTWSWPTRSSPDSTVPNVRDGRSAAGPSGSTWRPTSPHRPSRAASSTSWRPTALGTRASPRSSAPWRSCPRGSLPGTRF
jgi:hypothetical protein